MKAYEHAQYVKDTRLAASLPISGASSFASLEMLHLHSLKRACMEHTIINSGPYRSLILNGRSLRDPSLGDLVLSVLSLELDMK